MDPMKSIFLLKKIFREHSCLKLKLSQFELRIIHFIISDEVNKNVNINVSAHDHIRGITFITYDQNQNIYVNM